MEDNKNSILPTMIILFSVIVFFFIAILMLLPDEERINMDLRNAYRLGSIQATTRHITGDYSVERRRLDSLEFEKILSGE